MTPNCGRIDVKCSYHTRIGLGKWTDDPTLEILVSSKTLSQNTVVNCSGRQLFFSAPCYPFACSLSLLRSYAYADAHHVCNGGAARHAGLLSC